MLKLLARLNSWRVGIKIGAIEYCYANPRMSGPIECMLPLGLWDDKIKSQVRFHIYKYVFDGFSFKREGDRITCSHEELVTRLKEAANG